MNLISDALDALYSVMLPSSSQMLGSINEATSRLESNRDELREGFIGRSKEASLTCNCFVRFFYGNMRQWLIQAPSMVDCLITFITNVIMVTTTCDGNHERNPKNPKDVGVPVVK